MTDRALLDALDRAHDADELVRAKSDEALVCLQGDDDAIAVPADALHENASQRVNRREAISLAQLISPLDNDDAMTAV